MSEHQPELRWAPIPPKPSNRGRVWLLVGLSVSALAMVAALLFFLLPRGVVTPDATPSPTATTSPGATATTTPTPTPTPTSPSPDPVPIVTAPPESDPDPGAFRDQVRPWLGDAMTGLDFLSEATGNDALSILDSLQGDVQLLSGVVAPASMGMTWYESVSAYAQRLEDLRAVVDAGSDMAGPIDAARAAVEHLRSLVGL